MYSDEQLLPISGLQHIVFCERQCALIHVERVWQENSLTAEGQLLHRKTNSGASQSKQGTRIVRSIELTSRMLGLQGRSDVVEFTSPHNSGPSGSLKRALASKDPNRFDGWEILPIEYKRGRPKTNRVWGDCDRIQLCAQSLCLEEMLSVTIARGTLFYGEKKRRLDVELTPELRAKTVAAAERFHQLVHESRLPAPVADRRCKRCSLMELCMPQLVASPTRASRWIQRQIAQIADTDS